MTRQAISSERAPAGSWRPAGIACVPPRPDVLVPPPGLGPPTETAVGGPSRAVAAEVSFGTALGGPVGSAASCSNRLPTGSYPVSALRLSWPAGAQGCSIAAKPPIGRSVDASSGCAASAPPGDWAAGPSLPSAVPKGAPQPAQYCAAAPLGWPHFAQKLMFTLRSRDRTAARAAHLLDSPAPDRWGFSCSSCLAELLIGTAPSGRPHRCAPPLRHRLRPTGNRPRPRTRVRSRDRSLHRPAPSRRNRPSTQPGCPAQPGAQSCSGPLLGTDHASQPRAVLRRTCPARREAEMRARGAQMAARLRPRQEPVI
jgi:hypothetical protein